MNAIGIVPAAGVGKRWGHYPKFLLPCGDREWLLDRTVRAMPCARVVVVYSEATRAELAAHVTRTGLQEKVILKPNECMDLEMYGSMLTGIQEEADYYYFGMPDTYWPFSIFETMGKPGMTLGLHHTEMPERFGMLRGRRVIDKQPGPPGQAWGVLGWDRDVRDLWLHARIETYTQAINLAIQECGLQTVAMDYYYDMASFGDYAAFVTKSKCSCGPDATINIVTNICQRCRLPL